jgi:hypothetical protein
MKRIAFPPRTWIKFTLNGMVCIGITGYREDESFLVMNDKMYVAEVTWEHVSKFNVTKLVFKKEEKSDYGKILGMYQLPKMPS